MSHPVYREDANPIGEAWVIPPENGNGNGNGWDHRLYSAMLKPVKFDFTQPTGPGIKDKLIEMARYLDPAAWNEATSMWSNEAITKMLEPVYQGWCIQLSTACLMRLAEIA